MQITSAPPSICGTANTKVAFNASKIDATFLCQLTNTGAIYSLFHSVENAFLDSAKGSGSALARGLDAP